MRNPFTLRGERGFTLAETVIGAGLLAVAVVAVMQIQQINTMAKQSAQAAADYTRLVNQLNGTLLNQQTCTNALTGFGSNIQSLGGSSWPITIKLYSAANQPLLQAGSHFGTLTVQNLQLDALVAAQRKTAGTYPAYLLMTVSRPGATATRSAGMTTNTTLQLALKVTLDASLKLQACDRIDLASTAATSWTSTVPTCKPGYALTTGSDGTQLYCIMTTCPVAGQHPGAPITPSPDANGVMHGQPTCQ